MNLRKRPPASDNDKVVNLCLDKHLKHWPENLRRKRTAQLRLKSVDNNPGWCIKNSAMGWVELAKSLDDNDRLTEIIEGSLKPKRVRCPNVATLPNDSVIKVPYGRPRKRQKGARQKFRTFSTHSSLPEEVVEEILSRLPVKSLARFRCVCKSWHHLSYSKTLISLHLNNYRRSQFLVGTCPSLSSNCSMYFLQPPPPSGGYCGKDRASREIVKHEFPILFGGSCNGIVCLYGEYAREDIVLWNPATNESKRIRGLCGYGFRNKCTVGFGFDPMTNDYKILKLVYGKPNSPAAQMELYSLRTGSWKLVDSHDFLVVRNDTPVDIACSLPFTNNRIVCAVVSPINGASKWEIILFDMSSEMYEVILLPPSLDAELGDHEPGVAHTFRMNYFKLFPFKETIALGIVHRVGNGSYCDVWVLNDFSSTHRRGSRSWSKILSTDMNDGHIVPVGCWGSSQIIFQETWSRMLYQLDHSNNTMMELGFVPRKCVFTSLYKESLVRINDTKEDGDSKFF